MHRTAEVIRADPQAPWSFPMAEPREHKLVGLDEVGASGASQSGGPATALPGPGDGASAGGSVDEPGSGGTDPPVVEDNGMNRSGVKLPPLRSVGLPSEPLHAMFN